MNTKETLVKSTSKLIRETGYHGTGVNDILSLTQIPKGSLYHHFPGGKDEIIEAALEEAAIEMALSFKHAMKGKKNAAEGLKAVLDLYIHEFNSSNHLNGCPLAAVSLDVSSENDSLRNTCSRLFEFWVDALSGYMEYKGVKGRYREKAEMFLIRLEGALLLSRVQQSSRPLELAKKDLEFILK